MKTYYFEFKLYIFAFDLKIGIHVVCREFLVFKYMYIYCFFETNQMIYRYLQNSRLKSVFGTYLYLPKEIVYIRKIGVKCAYFRFLMYQSSCVMLNF